MIVPTIGVAGNDAVLDLTADQSVVDLPEGGVIDATGPDYRTGIAGIANGVNRIDATLKGPSLLVKVDEYDPDSTGGWTTYGIQARQGATINVGTSEEPLSKFEIQNHGKTTLSTGLMSWRGPNGTLADAHINVNSDIWTFRFRVMSTGPTVFTRTTTRQTKTLPTKSVRPLSSMPSTSTLMPLQRPVLSPRGWSYGLRRR